MPNYSGVWSLSQQFQGRGQGLWPQLPGAPTIGTATAGLALCASVAFTAPACAGVPSTITSYTVTSTPGSVTTTGAASPLVVTGLTAATSYTFKVKATNATGTGPCSAASNSITAKIASCATYTTAGTYSWVAPAGVTSVAVLAVGGGGGGSGGRKVSNFGISGAGGALAYRNAVAVTPGGSYPVVVGAGGTAGLLGGNCGTGGNGGSGGQSKFCKAGTAEAAANGGTGGYATGNTTSAGGTVATGTGGAGGASGSFSYSGAPGAGGAGGYSGAGGVGGAGSTPAGAGVAGTGGAAGGSSGSGTKYWCCCTQVSYWGTYCGGGVGLYGQGADGYGGFVFGCGLYGYYGGPGSGGTVPAGIGAGGGAGTGLYFPPTGTTYSYSGLAGGPGAVRIVWNGCGRGVPSFPSTNVGPS